MPERNSYEAGTPSWVDLSTPDVDASARFYGELFGWDTEETGTVEETGGYRFFLDRGRKVAGVGPIMQEGQPPAWATYFATDDADALTQRARDAGVTVLAEPMDVMDAGRLAFFAHPAAGMFGAWQAGNHKGAELVNEPVSLAWNQLITHDADGAGRVLEAMFGLRVETQDFGGGPYTILMLGENGVGGIMASPPGMPAEAPAFWNVSFAVAGADATVAKAQELGASVTMPAMDMAGVGRIAGLVDPQGAQFNIAELPS
jgi:predicted enzyme related to lactoylglutathione lyase